MRATRSTNKSQRFSPYKQMNLLDDFIKSTKRGKSQKNKPKNRAKNHSKLNKTKIEKSEAILMAKRNQIEYLGVKLQLQQKFKAVLHEIYRQIKAGNQTNNMSEVCKYFFGFSLNKIRVPHQETNYAQFEKECLKTFNKSQIEDIEQFISLMKSPEIKKDPPNLFLGHERIDNQVTKEQANFIFSQAQDQKLSYICNKVKTVRSILNTPGPSGSNLQVDQSICIEQHQAAREQPAANSFDLGSLLITSSFVEKSEKYEVKLEVKANQSRPLVKLEQINTNLHKCIQMSRGQDPMQVQQTSLPASECSKGVKQASNASQLLRHINQKVKRITDSLHHASFQRRALQLKNEESIQVTKLEPSTVSTPFNKQNLYQEEHKRLDSSRIRKKYGYLDNKNIEKTQKIDALAARLQEHIKNNSLRFEYCENIRNRC